MQEHRALRKVWREIMDGPGSDVIARSGDHVGRSGMTRSVIPSLRACQGWKETIRAMSIDEDDDGKGV